MQTSSQSNFSRLDSLESLRGLAALLIVVHHIPAWNAAFHDIGFVRNSYLMVHLFFVLSGFVIYGAYGERIHSVRDLARFQFLRFARLYPVHLLFLAAFLGVETLKWIAQMRFGIAAANTNPFEVNTLEAGVQHLFLLHAVGPGDNALTFNAAAWSISVEFYMYLLFGLTILVTGKFKDAAMAGLFLASIIMIATGRTYGFELMLQCVAGFSLGCMIARLRRMRDWSAPVWAPAMALAALAAFIHWKPTLTYDLGVYPLTAALIFSLASCPAGPTHNLLTRRPLVLLGVISYSLYMAHTLVLWVANQFVRIVLKAPDVMIYGRSTPQLDAPAAALAYACVLAATIALSVAVYVLVEKPLRERSRRFLLEPKSFSVRRDGPLAAS